jgi:hypothetical protein
MIQKIKKNFQTLIFALALLTPAMVPAIAIADTTDIPASLCTGSQFNISTSAGSQADCGTDANGEGINGLLKKIVNVISAVVGVVAVIMIVVGGFKYITSGGESSNVSGAKNTIIYAIIGLVIVALAQVIVHFVLNQTSSAITG